MRAAIVAESLGKRYRRPDPRRPSTWQEAAMRAFRNLRNSEFFWSLRGVSFTLEAGGMLGVIGRNGAGKSTLLRLLARVTPPDEGSVTIRGRIGGLLELGAGFHPDLTGRENAIIGGVVRGMTRRETIERFDSIVGFAEIASSIDHPLRTYSTGMQMRLAFAIAIHCRPDVLLVDEVLAVGDSAFQSKCIDAIARLREGGTAVVVVSHDAGLVAAMCDSALWLQDGRVTLAGPAADIIGRFSALVHDETLRKTMEASEPIEAAGSSLALGLTRFGSMEARVDTVRTARPGEEDVYSDVSLTVEIAYSADRVVESPILGISILDDDGRLHYETNTHAAKLDVPPLHGQSRASVEIQGLVLEPGSYWVDVGLYERDWRYAYDYHCRAHALVIASSDHPQRISDGAPRARWLLSDPVREGETGVTR